MDKELHTPTLLNSIVKTIDLMYWMYENSMHEEGTVELFLKTLKVLTAHIEIKK